MFCKSCGSELKDGAKFCDNCGTPVGPGNAPENAIQGKQISRNIVFCPDGKYRWTYELNLIKNPMIFWLIWRIFFFIFLGIFLFINIIDAVNWGFEKVLQNLPFLAYFLIGMTVVVGLGYLLYAAINGGKYCVIFEMDENGVNHKQMPKQAKKAQIIADLAILAGLASGRLSTIGAGMAASRTEMYSEFARVSKIKAKPGQHVIKLTEFPEHNQVYAETEDFEFVKDFIVSHCPNAKQK